MEKRRFLRFIIAVLTTVMLTSVLSSNSWSQITFKTLHEFNGKDGAFPWGPLIFDAAGNLYGTTELGGDKGCTFGTCGTVFEVTPSNGTWTTQVIHYFEGADGSAPDLGLTLDAAGNLYGMTDRGGSDDIGTVYKLAPNGNGSWTESVLYSFTGADGTYPQGGVTLDASGDIYGTTGWGCGMGCAFELTPNADGSWTEQILYDFGCCGGPTGGYPSGESLVLDAAGNVYGNTAFGGNSGCSPYGNGCYGLGVIFELSPNGDGTWNIQDLYKFTGGYDGESPTSTLVFDAAGNLYGTTFAAGKYGYGNVFKFAPNGDGTWKGAILHQFRGGKDGATPFGGVTFDAAGNLYGTTTAGGAYGYGVVYRLTPTQGGEWKENVIHAFRNATSGYPWSTLVFDTAGNLYGTTAGNGTTTAGTVFEIMP